jgi:hypothetical protein
MKLLRAITLLWYCSYGFVLSLLQKLLIMKKVYSLLGILFLATNLFAQNVGIGTTIPLDKLHVNGTIRSSGLNITNTNAIELGYGLVGKEANAGKIGYALFSPLSLDIIGAGTSYSNRKVRLWAEGGTTLEGPLNVTNINTYSGLNSQTINVNAFTKLGGTNSPPAAGAVFPAIKTMMFYDTTSTAYYTPIGINHGLNWNQILEVHVVIKNLTLGYIFPDNNSCDITITGSKILIVTKPPLDGLLGMPCKVYVTYTDLTD